MSRMEKSDSAIRAGEPANGEGQPTAERAEQRAGTKENPGGATRAGHRAGKAWNRRPNGYGKR